MFESLGIMFWFSFFMFGTLSRQHYGLWDCVTLQNILCFDFCNVVHCNLFVLLWIINSTHMDDACFIVLQYNTVNNFLQGQWFPRVIFILFLHTFIMLLYSRIEEIQKFVLTHWRLDIYSFIILRLHTIFFFLHKQEVNLIPLNDQEAHYLGVPKLEQIVLKQLLLVEEAQAGVSVVLHRVVEGEVDLDWGEGRE